MDLSFLASPIAAKFIRGLISVWAGDDKLLEVTSTIGFDFFHQKTKDFYEARKSLRFFEEIGDRVLNEIEDYIHAEHQHLKKGDVKVIVEAALEQIASKDFFNLCVSERLDPERVLNSSVNRLTSVSNKYGLRNDDLTGISRFVFVEFLSVLHSLPEFNRTAFKQILRDTEVIIDQITKVEARLGIIESSVIHDRHKTDTEYRQCFGKKFRKINLFGIDSRSLKKNYDLSIAYISMKLSEGGEASSQLSEEILGSEHIYSNQYCIITGAAGSGKTTLLSWLALQAAQKKLPEKLSEYNGHIPLFFKVRDYQKRALPSGKKLVQTQMGILEGVIDDSWISEKLKSGNFIFLIDGIDEVSNDKREEVIEWIVGLGQAFPSARLFITSRPYASPYLLEALSENELSEVEIFVEPMDIQQIGSFVECWYAAYCDEARNHEEFERLRAAKERLIESMSSSTNLRTISSNPLLCALICFVNGDREGFVPSARGELYTIATDTLLDRREKERKITFDIEDSLSKRQKLKILGYIASYFFDRRSISLPQSDIVQYVEAFLPSLNIDSSKSSEIVTHLSERSHILRSPSDGVVDFSHKTFQEYFYARRLIDVNNKEIVIEDFFSDEFREVVKFVFSLAPSVLVGEIIEGIKSYLNENDKNFANNVIFLYSCVNETTEVSENLRTYLSNLLNTNLPPKTTEQAERLSSAGFVIIEPLSQYAVPKYKNFWPYCVKALVGTYLEDAFEAMSKYAELGSEVVDNILLESKRFFPSNKYNEVVLSHCKTISDIVVSDIYDYKLLLVLDSVEKAKFLNFSEELPKKQYERSNVKQVQLLNCKSFQDLVQRLKRKVQAVVERRQGWIVRALSRRRVLGICYAP